MALSPEDARGFVAVAAQVLPFLFIASAVEARSIDTRTNRDRGLGLALLLPFAGVVCLAGEIVAIFALASAPGRFDVAMTGVAMVLATVLLLASVVAQFEREGLAAWRSAPSGHRWRTAIGLAALTVLLVIISLQIAF